MTLAPLVWNQISPQYESIQAEAPEGEWLIRARIQQAVSHITFTDNPEGIPWIDRWMKGHEQRTALPEGVDWVNDPESRRLWARSTNQEVGHAHSPEMAKDLIERYRNGYTTGTVKDVLEAAGFTSRSWDDGAAINYDIDIGKKGGLNVFIRRGYLSVRYDGNTSRFSHPILSCYASQSVRDDSEDYPVYWPVLCPDPHAVAAQFAVDVLMPYCTENRMDLIRRTKRPK